MHSVTEQVAVQDEILRLNDEQFNLNRIRNQQIDLLSHMIGRPYIMLPHMDFKLISLKDVYGPAD
jgi:hypothetical protein